MECKLRCVNVRSVSGRRRAFRPAFRVTEISDDWYRSTVGVLEISLGTPNSAGENFAHIWEHLEAPATSFGALTTNLGTLARFLGVLVTSLQAPRITVEQPGKNVFGNTAGAPRNLSYYLSFNNC
jgi:hypothetical protein